MQKQIKAVVDFKDPDLLDSLRQQDLSVEAYDKLAQLSANHEYFTLVLTFNQDGSIQDAEFV